MTRNIVDNAILLSAMTGKDTLDSKSIGEHFPGIISAGLHPTPFKDMRLGAMTSLMASDSIYESTVEKLRDLGVEIIEFTPPEVKMDGFISILNIDMKYDLPEYLRTQIKDKNAVKIKSVADAVAFNLEDSLMRIPYGQARFDGILADSTSLEELEKIKSDLEVNGRHFFDSALDKHDLDAILSINNQHASYAAVAKYPALTVPMGYKKSGEPIGLTFIGKPFKEADLLRIGRSFEKEFDARKAPEGFEK